MSNNQTPVTADSMKIVFCEVSSFMGIKHIQLDLDGRSAWLIGGNAETKSSLISALCAPLDSNYIPAKPIHNDDERGIISMRVAGIRNGEPDAYQIDIVFTPSNRTGSIKIKDKNGADIKAGKTFIKELFGRIGFDVFQFIRADKKQQEKMFKDLAGCGEQLDIIDGEIKLLEEDRKILKREIDSAQAVNSREARPFNDEEIDKYKEEPPKQEEITARFDVVAEDQKEWDRQLNGVKDTERIMEGNSETVIRLSTEILEITEDRNAKKKKLDDDILALQKKFAEDMTELDRKKVAKEDAIKSFHSANKEYETKVTKAKNWMLKHPRPTTDSITLELSNAREYKRMFDIINVYAERQKSIRTKQDEWQSKENDIKQKKADKGTLIENSQLPVKGLMINEDGITLNGVPLEQVNSQALLELGIEMSCALNPTLRTIFIREGSLFDMPHLKAILEKLYARGYQCIIEYVRPEGGELEIKYVERDVE